MVGQLRFGSVEPQIRNGGEVRELLFVDHRVMPGSDRLDLFVLGVHPAHLQNGVFGSLVLRGLLGELLPQLFSEVKDAISFHLVLSWFPASCEDRNPWRRAGVAVK